jgi:methionyl-tRNA formyltransferase
MNIVFIGASTFGLECLKTLVNIEESNVVGVITAPQDFSISYSKNKVRNVLHADIKGIAEQLSIPALEIKDGMKDDLLFNTVKLWAPDIFVVCGWYHMVPKRYRELAPAYGLHASLLPRYSGGAPLVWAMINDEREAGITFFQFADGVDNGPIVDQASTPIHESDTIKTLYERIQTLGLKLIQKNIPLLARGCAKHAPQNEDFRTLYPQRSPSDGIIDWNNSARQVYNFIRAQTRPYPGAFTRMEQEKTIHIWKASIEPTNGETVAGRVYQEDKKTLIGCGQDTLIRIEEISFNDNVYSEDSVSRILIKDSQLDVINRII